MLQSVEMVQFSQEDAFKCCKDDQVAMATFSKAYITMTALDMERSWNHALSSNNIKPIICSVRIHFAKSDKDVDGSLTHFCTWIQKMADVNKKELIALCFSSCRGLWMYLDQQSFTKIHLLLQRLRNLLSLIRWGRSPLGSAYHWPVLEGRCWDQDCQALKQHIWLGHLVQWWGITGLLPKSPDCHETKQISQMWREMEQNHRKACWESLGKDEEDDDEEGGSLVHCLVSRVSKQHGPVWTSGVSQQCSYPPPCLQALLKLALVPQIDPMSLQAIIMYFILDVANFLQCRDDLLKSFSHAFSIPSTFCLQIKGFWLLDHGFISQSMDLLLSPRSSHPRLSWQHRSIVQILLRKREAQSALRYLHWNQPTITEVQDLQLYTDIFLQNRCFSKAWSLIKENKVDNVDIFRDFPCNCERLGLCLHHMAKEDQRLSDSCQTESHSVQSGQAMGQSQSQAELLIWKNSELDISGPPPQPFSAWLFSSQSRGSLSSVDVVTLLRKSVQDVEESLPLPARSNLEVAWPKCLEKTLDYPRPSLSDLPLSLVHSSQLPLDNSYELISQSSDERKSNEEEEELLPFLEQPIQHRTLSLSVDSSESASSFATASTSVLSQSGDALNVDDSGLVPQLDSHGITSDTECQVQEETSEYGSEHALEDVVLGCPDLILTLDGAANPISFNRLSKETAEDTMNSDACAMDEIRAGVMTEDNFQTAEGATGFTLDVTCTTDVRGNRGRLNLPPQFYSNEDNQSAPSAPDTLMESDNFLSYDYDKLAYTKAVPEEIYPGAQEIPEVLSGGTSPDQKAKKFFSQNSLPTSTSQSFLDLEPLQRASDLAKLEKRLECLRRDSPELMDQPEILTSCALSENIQGFSTDTHKSPSRLEYSDEFAPRIRSWLETGHTRNKASFLEVEMNTLTGGWYKKPLSLQDTFMPIPIHRTERLRQLQVPRASLSVRSSPAGSGQPSSSEPSREKVPSGRTSPKKEAACFRSTSDRLGHCKLGSWWKQALETRRASTGLLPAIDQMSSTSPDKKATHISGRPYSQSLINFPWSPPKQKGDKREAKEVGKDEPVRRGSYRFLHRAERTLGMQRGAPVKRGMRVKKA